MAEPETDNPGLPIMPPLLPAGALILAIVLELVPLRVLAEPVGFNAQVVVGVLVLAVGMWLGISANIRFRREGTEVVPTRATLKIVASGPYRFTRNPMYLGMVLGLLALSLIFSLEWGVLLTPILWLALDRLIVVREEAYLTKKFGAEYEVLLNRTRRWL